MARKKILPLIEPGKAERVERDRARLMKLFVGADENKIDFIQDAVQQVAWLGITIKELQADIDQNGPVLPYNNGGNQKGLQVNPACKLLKDYQQSYNTLFRAMLPLVPEKPSDYDPLDEFRIELLTPDKVAADEAIEKENRERINAEIKEAQKKLDEMHNKNGCG